MSEKVSNEAENPALNKGAVIRSKWLALLEINNLYTLYDGEFLLSLEEFIKQYKQTKIDV